MTATSRRRPAHHVHAVRGDVRARGAPRRHGAIASMRGHEADPLSRGHICPKASRCRTCTRTPTGCGDRSPHADGGWREVSWDEAIESRRPRLAAVQREHGDDAVAVYLGNPNVHSLGALTHNPTLVRLLRTRNRFSATSVDQLPHHVVAWALYGHQFLLPVPDIDRTDLLVLVGHNPMASNGSLWTVPDFPQRRRELASRGGRLVVIDPRRTETAKVADEHHFVRPGSDAAVLLAVVRELLGGDGLAGPAAYVDGVDAVREAVERLHARARRAGQRHAGGCRARPRARPRRGARRPPSTGGWASRPRPTAWCASGRSRRSTCSPATSTGRAARCSPPRRSTSSGAGCSAGGFGTPAVPGAGAAGVRGRAAGVGARRGDHHARARARCARC